MTMFSSKGPLTDMEEAEIRAMIASDPDNSEITDAHAKRPMRFSEAMASWERCELERKMDCPDKPGNDGFGGAEFSPQTSPPGLSGWSMPGHAQCMKGYVYILASGPNGTLYTGVTTNPSRRWFEHQHELTPGFTSRYGVKTLVWIERHDLVVDAIKREKAIKKYPRQWKKNLIEAVNPKWEDVSHWLVDT